VNSGFGLTFEKIKMIAMGFCAVFTRIRVKTAPNALKGD